MSMLREPLVQFVVAGALLFAASAWLKETPNPGDAAEPVRVREGDIAWMKQTWSSQWLREPSAEEIKGLIDQFVEEQLLAREAAEMGLAEGDTIIRRRLAQKLMFLVEDTAQLADPTEQELRAFHVAKAAKFATPAKVSFEQRYFNPDGRRDAASDAAKALVELSAGREGDLTAGDRLLLGDRFTDVDERTVSSMFGMDFAREAFALPSGGWRGPLRSGYGLHLLQVHHREPGELRSFESVREAVLADWRNEKQRALARDYLDKLREKYGVELDDSAIAALDNGRAANPAAVPSARMAAE